MRIREKVPQLLDIDGDLVHHVHDAAKGLTSTFDTDSKLSAFCRAISTDHDWIRMIQYAIETICGLVGVKYTKPPKFADYRSVFEKFFQYTFWHTYLYINSNNLLLGMYISWSIVSVCESHYNNYFSIEQSALWV